MSYILCVETSTEVCSVALSLDDKLLYEHSLEIGFKHSSGLTQLISDVISHCDIKINDLDAVAISDGPGSYTGLRVGASSVKAICYSLDIPMIAVPTLLAICDHGIKLANNNSAIYIPTIDARRMEVYMAIYDSQAKLIKETTNFIYTEASLEQLTEDYDDEIILCGDGVEKLKDSHLIIPDRIIPSPFRCNSRYLCSLAYTKFVKKDFVDTSYHVPFYYKSPNITKPKSSL